MATGGVFQLITNDGKQDRMLMASEMLRNRLDTIRAKRRANPAIRDETPTLLDIERTHVLFTNAHFKPFVAIGYEYNKVNTGAGAVALGSEIQFSIPQFGDFFNDMVLYMELTAPDVTTSDTGADTPTVRWCDYPGERILKEVAFEVNGNPLDKYSTDSITMHRKFYVQPNKETGWNRCVGQEQPREAWLKPDVSGVPDDVRVLTTVTDGAQTPKAAQTGLTLLIPLLFWCNQDPRLAVPSVAIPFGQRYIKVKLATKDEMVGFQVRGAGSTANTSIATPTISNVSLYINNIFVNPEIHKIFIQRIGFTLIRVHREQFRPTSLTTEDVLLQNLKWPIEALFVGLRPTSQKTSLRDWHKFVSVAEEDVDLPNMVTSASTATVDASSASAVEPVVFTFAQAQATSLRNTKTIDRITVSAHGIPLYNDIPADFFNSYVPYTYGGPNIRTPEDEGALLIPFCLYLGTYQPSSHVNVSRAREFYIKFTSSVIGVGSPATAGELVVIAQAINFLLISDGSAVLRYST